MSNPLAMSDEEFTKLEEPGTESTEVSETETSTEPEENTNSTEDSSSDSALESTGSESESTQENTEEPDTKDSGIQDALNYDPENNSDKDINNSENSDRITENKESVDYKAFYEKVMSPVKANGKLLKLNSPEEAITLIQKGAGYTKRMQELAPYRKAVAMLEKANLLDEDQLSFLIDVHNKSPEAIRKLLKDGNIDTLDLELDDDPKEYVPGLNKVSDNEIQFKEAIDEVLDTPNGDNTIRVCNLWDSQSKVLLGQNPQLLRLIHEQIQNGVYKQVSDEVQRLQGLGQISSDTPFLQAYKVVGDYMVQHQQINQMLPHNQQRVSRPTTTRNSLNNNYKARQAYIPRTNPTGSRSTKNPLAMTDDEFMRTYGFK